jgi:hypothetical protein
MLALFISFLTTAKEPVLPHAFNYETTPEIQQQLQPGPDLTPLANLIGAVESDTVGGYNAANGGSPMDLGKDGLVRVTGRRCEEVTIREIKAWQKRGLLYAVGRYQMIPSTLSAAVKWSGLKDSDYFTPQNQDKMLEALLKHKRPSVWAHIKNGASINSAITDLAREWAGLPTLRGSSYYGYGNRSHASVPQVVAALEAARAW